MFSCEVILTYGEKYYNEVKVIKNVITIHRRTHKTIIHTKTYDVFIDNKDIESIEIIERTKVDYSKGWLNFDGVFDLPLHVNLVDEDKSYVD